MAYSHTDSIIVASQGLTALSGLNTIFQVPITLGRNGGTNSAASTVPFGGWRAVLPARPMTLNRVTMAFGGGASSPQGGTYRLRVWSNGVRKGLVNASVAGATTGYAAFSGLAATFPASAVAALSIAAVGSTGAGGGATPTLWLHYT